MKRLALALVLAACQRSTDVSSAPPAAERTAQTAPAVETAAPPPQQTAPVETPAELAPRIPLDAAVARIGDGSVRVLDVRDLDSYKNGHIPSAIHVPLARLQSEVAFLPKEKPILTYCT